MGIEVAVLSALTAAAGVATSVYSMKKQADAQEEITAQSIEQERLRKEQVELELTQKRRESVRSAQMARAQANVNTSSAGAGYGSSIGGLFAINTNLGNTIGDLNTANTIGQGLFQSNAAEAVAQGDANTWNSMGQFGQMLFQSSGQVGQLFGSAPGGAQSAGYNPWGSDVTVTRPA